MHKGKKITGGKYIKARKKKLYENPRQKKTVKLGDDKRKSKKVRGGNLKTFLLTWVRDQAPSTLLIALITMAIMSQIIVGGQRA